MDPRFAAFLRPAIVMPLIALAAFASSGAAATTTTTTNYDFGFKDSGFTLASRCDGVAHCAQVGSVGMADDVAGHGLAIPGSWASFATSVVLKPSGSVTGTWEWRDTSDSNNDLFGTFSGKAMKSGPGIASSVLHYTITGGDGLFTGATGTGRSMVSVNSKTTGYMQSGSLHVAAVPEPSTWALMAAGLFGLAVVSVRRRRAERNRV